MSNREYKSDAQRGYDNNRFDGDIPIQVIGGKSNLKTSVSNGVAFCPSCGAMMLPSRDGYKCNSCGYSTNDSVSKFSPKPDNTKKVSKFSPRPDNTKKVSKFSSGFDKTDTYLELIFKKNDIRINYRILISGYLKTKKDNLINEEVELYFSGKHVQTTFTDKKGYYQFTLAVNKPGKQEIRVVYRGNSEYEMSIVVDYVDVEEF